MSQIKKFSVFKNLTGIFRNFASKKCGGANKGGTGGGKATAGNTSKSKCESSGGAGSKGKSKCEGKADGKSGSTGSTDCNNKDSKCGGRAPASAAGNKKCQRGSGPRATFHAEKWRKISLFAVMPSILVFTIFTFATMPKHERPEFIPYDYMRKRDKKFFWGDGNHSFFHNKHVNALPEGYEDDD